MEPLRNKSTALKIAILWLAIVLMGSFWLTLSTGSDQASLTVLPEVPRQGEPIVTIFRLYNPSSQVISTGYKLYTNGELTKEGIATLPPGYSKVCQYAYKNPLPLGEQVNFMARTSSPQGNFEQMVSLPSYPPQIWSSFVSFASFSTSMFSSMNSMTYYNSTFTSDIEFNVGIVTIMVLIALLIFLELTRDQLQGKIVALLSRLRIRLSTVTWILLIIFMGMIYTRIVLILAT